MKNKNRKFKVGDIVKTILKYDPQGTTVYPIGTECTIIEIDDEDEQMPYLLKENNSASTHSYYYAEDMFERTESQPNKVDEVSVSPEAASDPENLTALIKPCPHCGNATAPDVWRDPDYCSDGANTTVVCNFHKGGCGACGGYYRTEGEAIENWNKRACTCKHEEESTQIRPGDIVFNANFGYAYVIDVFGQGTALFTENQEMRYGYDAQNLNKVGHMISIQGLLEDYLLRRRKHV